MEIERRILKNTSVLLGASFVSQLANFGFVIHIARAYGPNLFGEYSFALSLGSLLSVLVGLGTNKLLIRKCSQNPELWQSQAGLLFPVQTALAIMICVLVIGIAKFLGIAGTELHVVVIVASFQLLAPIWNLFAIGFTATERMAYAAMADAGGRLFILLAGSIAILLGADIQWVVFMMPVSALLALIVLSRLATREFGVPIFRFNISEVTKLLREAAPFFGIAALSIVYARTGLLLLRSIGGPSEVGVFASAERLVMAASILHVTFSNAIFPVLVRLATSDKDRFQQLANRCTRLVVLITAPLATVLFIFAPDLVVMLYGDPYREAIGVLRIATWLIAMRGLTAILSNIGIAVDRKSLVLASSAGGVVLLVASSLLLTPSLGAKGLGFALIAAQFATLAILLLGLRPSGDLPVILRPTLPIFCACAVTLAATAPLSGQAVWLRGTVIVALGSSLLWLFRAIRIADFAFLREVLRGQADRGKS